MTVGGMGFIPERLLMMMMMMNTTTRIIYGRRKRRPITKTTIKQNKRPHTLKSMPPTNDEHAKQRIVELIQ